MKIIKRDIMMDAVCVPPPPVSLAEWEEEVAAAAAEAAGGTGAGAVGGPEGAAGTNNGGGSSGSSPPSRTFAADLPTISEVEARNALLGLVADHCCWGGSAARKMAIGKILSTSAFHVRFSILCFPNRCFHLFYMFLVRDPNVHREERDVVGLYAARWRRGGQPPVWTSTSTMGHTFGADGSLPQRSKSAASAAHGLGPLLSQMPRSWKPPLSRVPWKRMGTNF